MAKEKLELDSQKLLKKLVKYSKHTYDRVDTFYLGEKESTLGQKIRKDTKYDRLSTWSNNKVELLAKVGGAISSFVDRTKDMAQFSGLKDVEFLKEDSYKNYSPKELKKVLNFLSRATAIVKRYESQAYKLSNPAMATVHEEYLKAFEAITKSLKSMDKSILGANEAHSFGLDAYAKLISQDDLQINQKSERQIDLEVVRALKFCGTTLEFDESTDQWVISSQENNNGLEYYDQNGQVQPFKIPNEQIQSFLDNYLNVHGEDRNGTVITAQGIFELYKQLAKPKLSLADRFRYRKEMSDINASIEKADLIYNMDSSEWKAFELTENSKVRTDATKLALASLFRDRLSEQAQDIIENALGDEFGSNRYLKGLTLKRLEDLTEVAYSHNLESATQFEGYSEITDVLREYDQQLDRFRDMGVATLNPEQSRLYSELLRAKAEVQLVSSFQKTAIEKILESTPDLSREDVAKNIGTLLKNFGNCEFLNVKMNPTTGVYQLELGENHIVEGAYTKFIYPALEEFFKNGTFAEVVNSVNAEYLGMTPSKGKRQSQTEEILKSASELEDYDILNILAQDENNQDIIEAIEKYNIYRRFERIYTSSEDNVYKRLEKKLRDRFPDKSMADIVGLYNRAIDNDGLIGLTDEVRRELPEIKGLISGAISDPNFDIDIFVDACDGFKNRDVYKANHDRALDYAMAVNDGVNKSLTDGNVNIETLSDEELFNLVNKVGRNTDKTNNTYTNKAKTETEASRHTKLQKQLEADSRYNALKNMDENKLTPEQRQFIENYEREKASGISGQEKNGNPTAQEKDGDEKQNDDAKEYTWRKYGQKNASFDTAGWIKKFKPYCGKTTEIIIDGWLKMIENTMIREVNQQTDQYGLTADDRARAKATKDNAISRSNPAADGKDSQDKGAEDQSNLDTNDDKTSPETDPANPSDEKSDNSGETADTEKTDDEKTAGDEESKNPDEEKSESVPKDGKTDEAHVNSDEDKARGEEDKTANTETPSNFLRIADKTFDTYKLLGAGIGLLLGSNSTNLTNLDETARKQLGDVVEVFNYITDKQIDMDKDGVKYGVAVTLEKAYEAYKREISKAIEEKVANTGMPYNGALKYQQVIAHCPNSGPFEGRKQEVATVLKDMSTYALGTIISITTEWSNGCQIGNLITDDMMKSLNDCENASEVQTLIANDARFTSMIGKITQLCVQFSKKYGPTFDQLDANAELLSPDNVTTCEESEKIEDETSKETVETDNLSQEEKKKLEEQRKNFEADNEMGS